MKILMFFPALLDHLPPLMNAAACLADCGAEVCVIVASSTKASRTYLGKHSVEVICLHDEQPQKRSLRMLLRILVFIRLLYERWRRHPDCIWYHYSHFINWYAFFPFLNNGTLTVAHVHELDSHVLLRWAVQKAFVRRASLIISPEVNRAWILEKFSGTRAPFFIVPNRLHENTFVVESPDISALSVFRNYGGSPDCSRFLIYQGAFMSGRCLEEIVLAFRMLPFKDTGLILLGGKPKSKIYGKILELVGEDNRIVLVPHIPSPNHLQVTKGCIGGIVLCSPTSLNNIYCAPNKIYEYASFGLGMILPDYPGLRGINDVFKLGYLCDPIDSSSINDAMIRLLARDPHEHATACQRFLESSETPFDGYHKVYLHLMKMIECNYIKL